MTSRYFSDLGWRRPSGCCFGLGRGWHQRDRPEGVRRIAGVRGFCDRAVTARAEDIVDLVMCGEEELRLPWRLEPPHDLLLSSCWPMTAFDAVVEPFVSTVISVRCLMRDWLNVAAHFVCDGDLGVAKLSDQPCHEALGGLGIAAALDKDVEHMAVGIYCAPQPMHHAVDRDHNLIKMQLVVQSQPVPSNTVSKNAHLND